MAVTTRAAWASDKNTKFADNSTGDISEGDLRQVSQDLADSVAWNDEVVAPGAALSVLAEDGAAVKMTPAERARLAAMEDSATADQTGAEMVTAIDTELGGSTWQSGGAGGGDVTKVGTPAANRMAYWTGDGTLGHETGFTYDPTTDTLSVVNLALDGVPVTQPAAPGADRLVIYDFTDSSEAYATPTGGLEINNTEVRMTANQRTSAIEFVIDGGGSAITTGVKGAIEVPFACTVTAARLLADQSGSIVVDIWKDTYANYPPTVADTITASAKPTISAAAKSQNTTLTGWTTALAAGDILRFNVDSAATMTRVTLSLTVLVS